MKFIADKIRATNTKKKSKRNSKNIFINCEVGSEQTNNEMTFCQPSSAVISFRSLSFRLVGFWLRAYWWVCSNPIQRMIIEWLWMNERSSNQLTVVWVDLTTDNVSIAHPDCSLKLKSELFKEEIFKKIILPAYNVGTKITAKLAFIYSLTPSHLCRWPWTWTQNIRLRVDCDFHETSKLNINNKVCSDSAFDSSALTIWWELEALNSNQKVLAEWFANLRGSNSIWFFMNVKAAADDNSTTTRVRLSSVFAVKRDASLTSYAATLFPSSYHNYCAADKL